MNTCQKVAVLIVRMAGAFVALMGIIGPILLSPFPTRLGNLISSIIYRDRDFG